MSDDEEIHGWVKLETEDGKSYFYNPDLNLTQWEEPEEGYQVVEDAEEEEEEEEEAAADEEPHEHIEYQEYQEQEVEEPHAFTEDDVAPGAPFSEYSTVAKVPEYEDEEGSESELPSRPATTARASSSSSSLSSSSRLRCKWELKQTASFGAGTGTNAGDTYYLNKETGETMWEKPDDYFDDSKANNPQIIITLAPITEDTTLDVGFDTLDLYGEGAQHELELLRSGDLSAAEACLKRLNYLEQLFQNVGTEEEWFDAIMDDEYALAATVYDYMTGEGAPPPEIRLTVCRLLVQMSKLDSQIGVMIMSERWGDLSFLMAQIHTGVGEAMTPIVEDGEDATNEKEEDTEQRMQALFAWFLLLSQLFTSTQDYGIPDEVLPSSDFYVPIIAAMEDSTEEVFLLACEACLAMNIHYSERSQNHFMLALMEAKENQHFGEALTWILNKQSAPYTNGPLLKQSLNALQDLFSDDSSCAYFYTNDLKVLVDIFVREITNLDTKDVMRTDYLMTLSLLLNRSSWVEHGRYRRGDIAACLESILDVGGDGVDGYEETALETVEIVLGECAAILEA